MDTKHNTLGGALNLPDPASFPQVHGDTTQALKDATNAEALSAVFGFGIYDKKDLMGGAFAGLGPETTEEERAKAFFGL